MADKLSGGTTIGGNLAYHTGNIPTWNQNTTGTASKVSVHTGRTDSTFFSVPWHSGDSLYSATNVQIQSSTGTLKATVFSETSDERVKTNIVTIEDPLELVKGLRGVSYNNINTLDKDEIGLVAQEVRKVVPEIVTEDDEGMLSVSYARVVALLVEGMKDQQKMIEALSTKISKLEGKQ